METLQPANLFPVPAPASSFLDNHDDDHHYQDGDEQMTMDDAHDDDQQQHLGHDDHDQQQQQQLPTERQTVQREQEYFRVEDLESTYAVPPWHGAEPLDSENDLRPVIKFVKNAVREQHKLELAETAAGGGGGAAPTINPQYKALLDGIRANRNHVLLRRLLIAFRTAGDGSIFHLLTSATHTGPMSSLPSSSLSASSGLKHIRLVHLILRLNPFRLQLMSPDGKKIITVADYSVADAQLRLILAIVSANSVFLVPVINSLWTLLTDTLESDFERESFPPLERTTRVHAAMAAVLRLCPAAETKLFSVMDSRTPYSQTTDERTIVWYYKQCLIVLNYLPTIQEKVIELIVDKCIEMDVGIAIDDRGIVTFDRTAKVEKQRRSEQSHDDTIFELEDDTPDNQSSPNKEAQPIETPQQTPPDEDITLKAKKLDSLMLLLFEYIECYCSKRKRRILEVYKILLTVFDSSIMVTHKSKFIQFLLMYICGFDHQKFHDTHAVNQLIYGDPIHSVYPDEIQSIYPDHAQSDVASRSGTLYREFCVHLINVLLNPYAATFTRQTAACYLASYVSRSSFVCAETACESVVVLLRWAETYIEELPAMNLYANDVKGQCNLHMLFYTVCQSAFYIMCFRAGDVVSFFRRELRAIHDDAVGRGDAGGGAPLVVDETINIGSERWNRICTHPLEPLRFCLESVRCEFLELAKTFHFMDDSIIERCKKQGSAPITEIGNITTTQRRKKSVGTKITIGGSIMAKNGMTTMTLEKERTTGGVGGLGKGNNPLDSFFPFDPFLLRRSHVYIEPYYRHWSEPTVEEEDAEYQDANFYNVEMEGAVDHDDSDEDEEDDDHEHEINDDHDEAGSHHEVFDEDIASSEAQVQAMSLQSNVGMEAMEHAFCSVSPPLNKWSDNIDRPRDSSNLDEHGWEQDQW